jgi:acetyltransferase-like isoleucine patch superfamily enzyme
MLWWRGPVRRYLEISGVEFGDDVRLIGRPIVSIANGSQIIIGSRSSLCSDSRYTALGVNHPVILRTLRHEAFIRIGEDVGISGATICAAKEVNIGNKVLIGANVTITDTDFHSLKPSNRRYNISPTDISASAVSIAENVFVGAGVYILKGVSIGSNSVIGAGSIVVNDIPDNVIAAGNPAKVLGSLP